MENGSNIGHRIWERWGSIWKFGRFSPIARHGVEKNLQRKVAAREKKLDQKQEELEHLKKQVLGFRRWKPWKDDEARLREPERAAVERVAVAAVSKVNSITVRYDEVIAVVQSVSGYTPISMK